MKVKGLISNVEYQNYVDRLAKDVDGKDVKVGDKVVYALAQRNAGPVYMGKVEDIYLEASYVSGQPNVPDLNNVECWLKIKGINAQGAWRGTKKVDRRPKSIAKI